MMRRAFLSLLGGAAASATLPRPLRAQASAMPVVGFLFGASQEPVAHRLRAFRESLKEAGYIEGENASIIYRFGEGQADRLPGMLADLIQRQVTVIAAMSTVAAVAAKAATTTIPIVFFASEDPVRLGLVASLARPGGNATGINVYVGELAAKRLELLRELVPAAKRVGVLVDPNNKDGTESTLRDIEPAARAMGLHIEAMRAATIREIDAAFASLVRAQVDALFVGPSGFFASRRIHITNRAMRHGIPATYSQREYAEVGGLMTYGTNFTDAWRQIGAYTGRVLKGVKPADLPVVQASKFELVINAQTARTLGLTVPQTLMVAADEVIE
jgi:putative ABC transport system substrate-binding protein